MLAVNGQVFNHEPPRPGETFVTRKITSAVSNIVKGNQKEIWMGNLDSILDQRYKPETDGMWRMLQADEPEDFGLDTGTACTIKNFQEFAFAHVSLGWSDCVKLDDKFFRPIEVDELAGHASKAKQILGWDAKVLPLELARIMVDADIAQLDGASEGEFQQLNGMRALITGAAGQDGIILSTLLTWRGVSVTGLVKPVTDLTDQLHYAASVEIIKLDLADTDELVPLVLPLKPSHIWNFWWIYQCG